MLQTQPKLCVFAVKPRIYMPSWYSKHNFKNNLLIFSEGGFKRKALPVLALLGF
ncbi:hypothetical protein [Acinetobacter sp. YH12237]|uniref:hypothetical protein n=1 Tax=Acinetobacter sp. YH12237 TaxID=2601164 RepID=UPI0015D19AC4|nr:hypothetical protein [Acinetobacter sp. YH12237]